MDFKERVSAFALVVSIFALTVSVSSAVFSVKQYRLNQVRDQRELAARQPTFDISTETVREERVWSIKIQIANRNDAKLTFDFVVAQAPEGVMLSSSPDLGPGTVILNGIAPRANGTWEGFVAIREQAPGGRNKQLELVFAYRFIDEPDTQIEKTVFHILR